MRRLISVCLLTALAGSLFPSGRLLAQKKEGPELANKVYAVFEKSCFPCHGKGGLSEAGFGTVLDHAQLVQGKVVPGKADKSRLWKRMGIVKDMPPTPEEHDLAKGLPRPTDAELALVKQWIEGGAPVWVLETIKPRPELTVWDELKAMRDYLRKADQVDRPYLRFFTLRHLHNMPPDQMKDADLRLYRAALSKLVNSLSWKKQIVEPKACDEAGTVLVVDIRNLDWAQKQLWPELLKYYPYALRFDGLPEDRKLNDLADEVYMLGGTRVPAIRADWFITTASRPPLYHTMLQLPHNAYDLEKKLGVNVAGNFRTGQLARAAFNGSGVSGHNRLVERHDSDNGAYWKSYDFKSSAGRKNLFVFPLGPSYPGNPFERHHAFKHDGGEIIFNLPNGMQGYMLVDGKDGRIDEGPIAVVSDTKRFSGTPEVVNGISCMGCHQHGMIGGFKDVVRMGHVLGGKENRDQIYQIYPPAEKMNALLARDKKMFMRAVEEACEAYLKVGSDAKKDIYDFRESVTEVARTYVLQEMKLVDCARELGVAPADLLATIKNNPLLRERGLYPLTQGSTIKREVWENLDFIMSAYQEAAREMKLGTPITHLQ